MENTRTARIPLVNEDTPARLSEALTSETLSSMLPPKKNYQVNGKFYVRLVSGLYQNLRRLVSVPLLLLFFATVWIPWGDHPAVLFSFAERRIFLFGLTLSWYDLPLLAGLLIAGAALLFFAAVAYGRVWCGFACPQSVWTWLFIRIEQLVEGDARKLKKMDEQGLTAVQWLRRGFKHLAWLAVGLVTAVTFAGYFMPMPELLVDMASFDFLSLAWAWTIIMGLLTYANAGLVREKICTHACPYARFQSVMFDADTRTVSYDIARGEPRSRHQARAQQSGCGSSGEKGDAKAQGDCVDCSLCVQVCPVGIDIRNGLQLPCIDCGACIDACDGVMKKLGKATGLIRFASENQLLGKSSPFIRPKLLSYGAVMAVCVGAVLWGFLQSTELLAEVHRSRGQLYVQRPDDRWCNDFEIKLESFVAGSQLVNISVSSQSGAAFELMGPEQLDLHQNQGHWQNFRVCSSSEQARPDMLVFNFNMDGIQQQREAKFIVPR
ncbi:cytochrome c oxidase accessory protein CcoG [Oceanobacter mangrovi]|uniref:cytochrome c oxidase accessory protein CcoG n=1 Tax=Oceanobacter mangrovi TaxID=2862510 RepID=UPI001C8E3190|nr:cytochrome c oxidase accessory protein CcoG [Oceanobacter mangrovi]